MAGYLGASPVPQTIQKKESFTATAGQTTFNTTGYTDGNFINVFLNGVRLVNGTDYTATNGSDIVLTAAASASDVLDFETFNEFTLVDQTLETPTFRTSATLKNDTHEDTDGGRESTLIFKGEQSGGEISTLAEIEASHDGTADDEKGDLIFRTNDGSDGSSPTEAARIDSGQNLLVGKTAVGLSTTGIDLRSNGLIQAIRDGGTPVELNRQTSDGTLIDLRKDNSTVGTISTTSGGFYVNGTSSVNLNDGTNEIGFGTAAFAGNGSGNDNAIDLGRSNRRFKDLYLSGGAYLGGTGASNKLEDYEEGTFTPTVEGSSAAGTVTYTTQDGNYTKIGRMVTIMVNIVVNTISGMSGTVRFKGLPFTLSSGTNSGARGVISMSGVNYDPATYNIVAAYPSGGAQAVQVLGTRDSSTWVVFTTSHFTIGAGDGVAFQITYFAD